MDRLDWVAQHPRATQWFAEHVRILCRDMPNKAVARLLPLHAHTSGPGQAVHAGLAGQDAPQRHR